MSINLPVDIKDTLVQNRFVCVNVLNVRLKPAQKSKLIGMLYLGDVVTIVQKKEKLDMRRILQYR